MATVNETPQNHDEQMIRPAADAVFALPSADLGDSDLVAATVFDAVPDGWAKVAGEWVRVDKAPHNRTIDGDVQADWNRLTDALTDGRLYVKVV